VSGILPNRFLFRYSLPVRYDRRLPKTGKKLLSLTPEFALPEFSRLDEGTPFGELRLAWNERGLGIALEVEGKRKSPQGSVKLPDTSDGLRLFIDTRDTQNIHRASRYCQQFFISPVQAASSVADPWVIQPPILRAREEAPPANLAEVRMAASVVKGGYSLEAWLPASVLHGFDPEAQPRLGFYYALRDAELGEQFLTVGADFPFAIDPSLWSTLELVKS
jgi:hypothetical protein